MEDQLNELEKEAAKEKPKEEKEVLIPELEKKKKKTKQINKSNERRIIILRFL